MYQFTPEYEALFEASARDMFAPVGGKPYITRTIKSGAILEAETHQMMGWQERRRLSEAVNTEKHREAVRKQNEKNSEKRMRRLMECNFGPEDLRMDATYAERERPVSIEQARRDVQNFFDRVRTWRKKHELSELKYIYVIEGSVDGGTHIHHHIIMSGMDRDAAEMLWKKKNGGRTRCDHLQPDDEGFGALAHYLCKQPRVRGESGALKKEKRWNGSRNLKKPVETESLSRISRRKAERIATTLGTDPGAAREVYERAYPGYRFIKLEVRWSAVVPGPYLYAQMIKDDRRQKDGSTMLGMRGTDVGMPRELRKIRDIPRGGGQDATKAQRRRDR